jgi:hypothetical protein
MYGGGVVIMVNKLGQKETCFKATSGGDCPPECIGMIASKFIRESQEIDDEGTIVQVCPNPNRLGDYDDGSIYCGNGPDVVIMHRDTVPSDEEYLQASRDNY